MSEESHTSSVAFRVRRVAGLGHYGWLLIALLCTVFFAPLLQDYRVGIRVADLINGTVMVADFTSQWVSDLAELERARRERELQVQREVEYAEDQADHLTRGTNCQGRAQVYGPGDLRGFGKGSCTGSCNKVHCCQLCFDTSHGYRTCPKIIAAGGMRA